jgi:cell division protein FtsI/penicillin-binding protein 2
MLDEYKGIVTKLSWERKYIYGDTLRGILGNISSESTGLTSTYKEYYLKKGYKLTDRVGISGLEYQYEDYLKGTKSIYKNTGNGIEEIVKSKRGNDIVLTIDIKLQLEIEKIMEEEMIKAKKEPNTQYFNRSFTVISNPNTGEILAMAAKIISNNKVYDYSAFIPISSVTVGSVIKGASISVGYKTGAINIGTIMKDECIKLANTPLKCSWLRSGLGNLTDIDALRLSSNSYQFKIAMRVAGFNYIYNGSFSLKNDTFKTYRDMFNSYGLGVKTGIDLPNESRGIVGMNDTPGLILDFSIGQYDTYTPLQLTQYINTVASNGNRIKLNLLKEVHESSDGDLSNKVIYKTPVKVLNKVDLDSKYISRIQEGFISVLAPRGLGYGYINTKYKPAGKTGTSQSFYDSNKDGVIDKQTITSTFAGYAPYDNPKMSITVISPDIGHIYGSGYMSLLNWRITQKITKKYFEIYK